MTALVSTERTRWDIVAIGFLSGVVGMFQIAKMTLSLGLVQQEIGLSLLVATLLVTVVSLTGAVFGIQAGRVSAEFGVARTLVFALVLSALAGVVNAIAVDPLIFAVARTVEGVGYLLVCAAAPAMMAANAAPRDRGVALAIWGAFVPVSVSLMSLVGPPVLDMYGWRGLFLGSAGSALLVAVAVVVTVRDHERPSVGVGAKLARVVRSAPSDYAALYSSPSSLGLGVAFMCFAAMQIGFIALEPAFLVGALDKSLTSAGLILTATTPFAILGTLIAGVLQSVGAPDAPSGALGFLGMAAAGSAVFVIGPDTLSLIAAGVVFFTAGGVVGSVLFASLPKRATPAAGVELLSGLLVQFGNVGALVGAPILAGLVEIGSWTMVPVGITGMAALGLAGVYAGRH